MTMDAAGIRKLARALPNDRRIVEREWGLTIFVLVSLDGRVSDLGECPLDRVRIVHRGRDVVESPKKVNSGENSEEDRQHTNSSKNSHAGLRCICSRQEPTPEAEGTLDREAS